MDYEYEGNPAISSARNVITGLEMPTKISKLRTIEMPVLKQPILEHRIW